ncbi:MAG: class I SAM-dependent methyltransferase [Bacteroidota bacterium]
MSSLQRRIKIGYDLLAHLWGSKSRYRIHSPLVYTFVTEVLPHKEEAVFNRIHKLRESLSQTEDIISWEELGAGSLHFPQASASVKDLVRRVVRRHREGALLYRICKHYAPTCGLELGTHLGISSIYQALGIEEGRLMSIEGVPAFARLADKNLRDAGVEVELRVGKFEHILSQLAREGYHLDYIFLDGNHTYEATKAYFQFLLPMLADGGILVLDDIYWSGGMRRAWREISDHPEVSVSLDLFFFGVCFIRRPQAKEHFPLRFLPF